MHPEAHAIVADNDAWTATVLLPDRPKDVPRIREVLGSHLVCMGFPDGARERVLDICNMGDLGFVLDDDLAALTHAQQRSPEQARTAVKRYGQALLETLTGEPPADAPFPARAVRGLFHRIRSRVSEPFFDYLLEGFAAWLGPGQVEELTPLDPHDTDPLGSYLKRRHQCAGCVSYERYAQYILGIESLTDIVRSDMVRAYHEATNACWVLPNDLLSFRKECFHDDHNNAICVLRRTKGLTLQEAVDEAAARLGAAQLQVLNLEAKIMASPLAGDDLQTYLRTLQAIAAANQRWSYMTPRYHGENFRWTGALTGTFVLHPDHTRFPPIPAGARLPATRHAAGDHRRVGAS